jgi:hypothetical protein
MSSDEFQSLQGQLEGVSLVLIALISSLPASQAARAKVELGSAVAAHCDEEREDSRSELTRTLIRESYVEAYLGLLAAAASSR